jgi:hypothetical protein
MTRYYTTIPAWEVAWRLAQSFGGGDTTSERLTAPSTKMILIQPYTSSRGLSDFVALVRPKPGDRGLFLTDHIRGPAGLRGEVGQQRDVDRVGVI